MKKNSGLHWLGWTSGLILGLIICCGAVLYLQTDKIKLGAQAYLYGYPLVLMDLTRANSALSMGPENQLHFTREFPDANFKGVVRPNADTLYTSSFIDMQEGPWVLDMPANTERYELIPLMDAWSHVFASPGTRQGGAHDRCFLLAGPTWQGSAPPELELLRSPTRMVWLLGRTQTNGSADYPAVHRIQNRLRLQSLADWQQQRGQQRGQTPLLKGSVPIESIESIQPISPLAQMEGLSAEDFFVRLMRLMADNPGAAEDAPMLQAMAGLGLVPGQTVQLAWPGRWRLALGRWLADRQVGKALKQASADGAWFTPPLLLGQYGMNYDMRAAVARVGLGANLPQDAMYPNTRVDHQGQPLNGKHRYRLHFEASQLPPVKAFWSITAYGADDFFIDNPLHRFALGDRDPLLFNPDGSLDLWIQAQSPEPAKQSNWLPVQEGAAFLLNARLYWPKPQALDGRWQMPRVERLP